MTMEIFSGIAGGLLGLVPGVGGAIGSTVVGVGSAVAMTAMFSYPGPADTSTFLGSIIQGMQNSYEKVSNHLFMEGQYKYKSKNGKKEDTIKMVDLMSKGGLMEQSSSPKDLFTSLIPVYERIIFQQLAWFTWRNLEQDGKHMPFIAFDKGPCNDVDHDSDDSLSGSEIVPDVSGLGSGFDFEGNCFYLLDARPEDSNPLTNRHRKRIAYVMPTSSYICGAKALPGGTNQELKENQGKFAELSLKDFIVPSVKGWKANGKKNGYPAASEDGKLVNSPLAAGALNIPVCDYLGNKKAPGSLCPKLGAYLGPREPEGCEKHVKD